MRRSGLVVGLVALGLVWATGPQSVAATDARAGTSYRHHHDDEDSRLVWSRFDDFSSGTARIVIGDPEGDGVLALTHPAAGEQDIDPALSPNGRWVAFERDHSDGSAVIGLVGADGRGERVLDLGCRSPCDAELTPTWDPDGRHLYFTRVVGPYDRPNESAASAVLWRTDLRGRTVTRFSQPGIDGVFEDYKVTFAPAGYVVFVRVRNADGANAVFRMNRDGSSLRRLTPWPLVADLPAVSPARNGPSKDLVVFETYGHGPPEGLSSAVATVSASCGSEAACARSIRYLTPDHALPEMNFNPNWSPDGRRIAFVRFSFVDPGPPVGDIWSMTWNGGDKEPVSESPLFEFRPAWGPAAAG